MEGPLAPKLPPDNFALPGQELAPVTVAEAPAAGRGLALDHVGRVPPKALPRIITGRVSAAAVILGGTGFTVTTPSTGTYVIVFDPAFPAPPVVLCDVDNAGAGGGNYHSKPDLITAAGCTIVTGGADGTGVDKIFNFVVHEMV